MPQDKQKAAETATKKAKEAKKKYDEAVKKGVTGDALKKLKKDADDLEKKADHAQDKVPKQ
jgi:hypothetical protein